MNDAAFAAVLQEHIRANNTAKALALCEQRLAEDSEDSRALSAAGALHLAAGNYEQATPFLRRAVRLRPQVAEHWGNLGVACLCRSEYGRAARLLARARRLCGGFSRELALACRGHAAQLFRQGNWEFAARRLREALREEPADAVTWSDLGALYGGVGKVPGAIRCFTRAVDLDPQSLFLRSNLAVILNYRGDLSPEQVRDRHLDLFQHLGRETAGHANESDPARKLRVGYYSADFRFRPPAFFIPPLLEHHNRNQFVIFCYSNTQYEDEYTEKMRRLADYWRDVRDLDDRQAADLVRADRIDILVDRTGHFERGRPGLFSLSPAPVQVSLPGYPATTGVPGIQYRITDGYADPPGTTEHLHSETLVRLPHSFACYRPADRTPEITPLPALRNGYVTFGCFQKREKITGRMLGLWAQILAASPDSRILFHHLFSGIREVPREFRRTIERFFTRRGVTPERVQWVGQLAHYAHVESIANVDIALDTFPYNGMTTTCECLWMGVPVVTLAGRAHVSRVGLSYLHNAGLGDWVASTQDEYKEIALRQAGDLARLERTRRELRIALKKSPLLDAATYTRDLEDAFRWMWGEWLRQRRTGGEL
jgi:protein O-GlcNAc transferase